MAFEFFFGVFGLISSDSKSCHRTRLESEWRLSTPLNAGLFRDSELKSPLANQRPIFSTTGTLAASSSPLSNSAASEQLFSSASSSSASSVASSGSNLTASSSAAFIKSPSGASAAAAAQLSGKYEFRPGAEASSPSAGSASAGPSDQQPSANGVSKAAAAELLGL